MRFFSTLIALLWSSVKGHEPKANPSGQIYSAVSSSTTNYSSPSSSSSSTEICSFSSPSSSSSTEICSFPSSCLSASSTSSTFPPPEIESKFYAMNPLESCNIEHFCIKNPPGSYCYTPVREILGRRKCKCLKTAFIECPFGVVNACKRGFVCGQGVNSIGITTAFCSRMATATYKPTQMLTTSMVPTRIFSVSPSSTLVIVASTVYNTQPAPMAGEVATSKIVTTSIPFTTSVQFTLSTAYPLITRISTLLTSSVPVTLGPKAIPTITMSDCGAISFSVPSVFPETGLATQLCRGLHSGREVQREPYVIRCIESVSKTSSSGSISTSAMGSVSTSASTSVNSTALTSISSTASTINTSTALTINTSTTASTINSSTSQPINTSTFEVVTTINGQVTTIFQAGETISIPPTSPLPPPITTFYPFGP